MKTKREFMFAKLGEQMQNARNYGGEKEQINHILVVSKKTERVIVDARFWMSASRNANTVYCSIWLSGEKGKANEGYWSCGKGTAGGYGYHKQSAALQAAIHSAGIELYGSPYNRQETIDVNGVNVVQKVKDQRAYFGGCGDSAMIDACKAIAYALGCNDAIVIG